MSTRNRGPYLGAVRARGIPRPGVRILHRAGLVALIVASLVTGPGARDACGQEVVPPGATYIGPAAGPAAPPGARWQVDKEEDRLLRVRFEPPPEERPSFWASARRALDTWSDLPEAPFRFELVSETERADVEFRWIHRFSTYQAGTTHRRLDADGRIERVTVLLAREHADGTPMSDEFLHLVGLHEVGHVLGLPHSEDPGDVMHPGNRNLTISPRDRQTLAALYAAKE